MIYIIYFKVLVDFTEYCTTISGHFRRFSQRTCGKMHAQILLGVQWCAISIFLFLKFYNFIKGTM